MICISRQKGMWESAQEEPHSLRGSGLRESAVGWAIFPLRMGYEALKQRDMCQKRWELTTILKTIHLEGLLFVGQRGHMFWDSPQHAWPSSYRGKTSGWSPEVCPEATKSLKRPTMCLVSCLQMLNRTLIMTVSCKLGLRIGQLYTVVKLFRARNTDHWLWLCVGVANIQQTYWHSRKHWMLCSF